VRVDACAAPLTTAAVVHAATHGAAGAAASTGGGGALRPPPPRAACAAAFGLTCAVVCTPVGRAWLRRTAADAAGGRTGGGPNVSNLGVLGAVDAANAAAARRAAGGRHWAVRGVRLFTNAAPLGAPLSVYAATVGGRMEVVVAGTSPGVPRRVLADVRARTVAWLDVLAAGGGGHP